MFWNNKEYKGQTLWFIMDRKMHVCPMKLSNGQPNAYVVFQKEKYYVTVRKVCYAVREDGHWNAEETMILDLKMVRLPKVRGVRYLSQGGSYTNLGDVLSANPVTTRGFGTAERPRDIESQLKQRAVSFATARARAPSTRASA